MRRVSVYICLLCAIGSTNAQEALILPFDADSLTGEQKTQTPVYVAYPAALKDDVPTMKCEPKESVDLGLPSGLKWATCNIGASCPEEIGNYYAWGETETKNNYEWDNYKWYDGIGITKYPDKYYTGTSLFTMNLEPSDDAAHVIWRGSWRMPTNKECNELNKCRITEAVLNGVKGYKVTASNGKSIFFPQDGYWSSTIHLTDPFLAYGIFSDCSSRYIGRCVRPVCP